ETERDEARVPVPAVADGGFGDVGLFGAIRRRARAAGRGVKKDVDGGAAGGVGEVERVGRVDAGVGEDEVAVEAKLGVVVEAVAGQDQAFAVGEVGGGDLRAVEPEGVLKAFPGANVLAEVQIGEIMGAGPVELHGAGGGCGNPVFRSGVGGGESGELPGGGGESADGHGRGNNALFAHEQAGASAGAWRGNQSLRTHQAGL